MLKERKTKRKMKVHFSALLADAATIEVQVENQWLPLFDLNADLCPFNTSFAKNGTDEVFCEVAIANVIQGVRYTTGGAVTTLSYTVVDNDRTIGVTQFANQTINIFDAKQNYAIPYAAGLVLPMTPPDNVKPVNGSASLLPSNHYAYISGQQQSILGATSVTDVWTWKVNADALASIVKQKNAKKLENFAGYVG